MSGQKLVKYDQMCRAIEAAHAVDEVKEIRDKAIMWELYSKQALNVENELLACQIRLRSEKRAGQLLTQMEKAKGVSGRFKSKGGNPRVLPANGAEMLREDAETLKELGITKKQSAQWQRLGAVSQRDFERALAEAERPTTAGITFCWNTCRAPTWLTTWRACGRRPTVSSSMPTPWKLGTASGS